MRVHKSRARPTVCTDTTALLALKLHPRSGCLFFSCFFSSFPQVGGVAFAFYLDQSSAHAEGFSLSTITDFFSSDKKEGSGDGDGKEVAAPVNDDEEEEPDGNAGPDRTDLPTITLDEVRNHTTEGDIWVTYEGVVYDVSSFVDHHPGGKEL